MIIKCKDCPYRTEIQCQGHGDYWAECTLIKNTKKILAKILKVSEYDIRLRADSIWAEAITEESTCRLFEVNK